MALRLALRRLAATPVFTTGIIAVLALGSGATLAVFTVLNALVLRTLPVPEADRLVAIEVRNTRGEPAAFPVAQYRDLAGRQTVFDAVAGMLGGSVVSTVVNETAHRAVVDGVTADYFRLLGTGAIHGRVIGPDDFRGGGADADAVCVVTDAYRQRVYGASADVLGARITLGEGTFTIVGILPGTFSGIDVGVRTDVVVPAPAVGRIIGLAPGSVPLRHVMARLAPGRTLDEARAELSAIWPSILATSRGGQAPVNPDDRRLVVSAGATGVSTWRARYRSPLQVTMLASGWLLVIACANLAGLQLTRALRRSRDTAVARALGAGPWDLARPTVLESALLCAAGLLLGVPLAAQGARRVTGLLSTGAAPLDLDLAPDWISWTAVAVLFTLVTVLAGLAPAWLAQRRDPGLSPGARVAPASGRAGAVLVVGQIALAVTLLAGASQAVAALLAISLRDHGFNEDGVVAAQLMNRPGGYAQLDDTTYYPTLVERVASLPGASAAALAKPLPGQDGTTITQRVAVRDRAIVSEAAVVMVSPGYFDVLGVPVLSGRTFDWRDAGTSPRVALVSRALARDLFPSGPADGLRIDVGTLPYRTGLEVVGVVEDASVINVRDRSPRMVYLSLLQQPPPIGRWPGLLVRTAAGNDAMIPAIHRAVDALGHEFAGQTVTLDEHVTRSLGRERLLAAMALVYGWLAVAMVAIGLWALLAHDVTRRVQEFGVRLSLGASPASLRRAVTLRALGLAAMGSAVGTGAAWMLASALEGVISGSLVAPYWTIAGVVTALLGIALAASAGPARHAARTNPMTALRSE